MKLKKLIPAFALLLISAVVLSTASFAWFSMNTKVTAGTMTVHATASKNLLISGTQNGDYLPSLSINNVVDGMVPCSTTSATYTKFYKMENTGTNMDADSSAFGSDSTFEEAASGTDYLKQTMWIKSTGQDAANLKAKIITTAGGTQDLDASLRVMIVVGGVAYIYTPIAGASAYKGISNVVAGAPTVADANQTITTYDVAILTALTADEAVQVDVYIWYEGQDAACKSTNAVTLESTIFTIEFTVD